MDDGGPITRGTVPPTVTASDPSSYHVIRYDLAIAKTLQGIPDYLTGNVLYFITVQNQGDVDSAFTPSPTPSRPAPVSCWPACCRHRSPQAPSCGRAGRT